MRHHFLIGLAVAGIFALPVGCAVVSFILSALGGIGEHSGRTENDEAMRRWLEVNAERRDWAQGDSDERRR